jgi:hypothetical protein
MGFDKPVTCIEQTNPTGVEGHCFCLMSYKSYCVCSRRSQLGLSAYNMGVWEGTCRFRIRLGLAVASFMFSYREQNGFLADLNMNYIISVFGGQ